MPTILTAKDLFFICIILFILIAPVAHTAPRVQAEKTVEIHTSEKAEK